MRITGFTVIICPICSQLYKRQIIVSTNSIGASFFSDNYVEGPFILHQPSIIKCINDECGQFLQVSNLKSVATIDYNKASNPDAWETAYDLRGYKMKIKDLLDCLSKDICNTIDNEIIVRTQLLWRFNDNFRDNKIYELSDQETNRKSNIERLIEIKKDKTKVQDKLFLAELYREISDFESCIKALNEIKNETHNEKTLKEKIFSQAKIKNNIVFNVNQIAIKKEYKCNYCGENFILFDLEKLNSPLQYRHFLCRTDSIVFNSSLKIQNPIKAYNLNKLQKVLKLKKSYERFIDNPDLTCPVCKNKNIEEFIPEHQKCIKCGTGDYVTINWFNN